MENINRKNYNRSCLCIFKHKKFSIQIKVCNILVLFFSLIFFHSAIANSFELQISVNQW